MFEIFAQTEDDQLIRTATCDSLDDARQLVKVLNSQSPNEYMLVRSV